MTWLLLLTLLGISLACAFYGTSLLLWSAAMSAGIVVLAATGSVPLVPLIVIAAIFALPFVHDAVIAAGRTSLSFLLSDFVLA